MNELLDRLREGYFSFLISDSEPKYPFVSGTTQLDRQLDFR
jgi:hypothetical protein